MEVEVHVGGVPTNYMYNVKETQMMLMYCSRVHGIFVVL